MSFSRSERRLRKLIDAYANARHRVVEAGYWPEIHWMDMVANGPVTEPMVLREAAWVILSSGMRESVVRAKFSGFSKAFLDWRCAKSICQNGVTCRKRASAVFGHQGKISAILTFARYLSDVGIQVFLSELKRVGAEFLQRFPYLGPATSKHLAKNLGIAVAKPDRHLLRIARVAKFDCVNKLCAVISDSIGEAVATVDLVLWRYATINRGYEAEFAID